MEDIVAVTSLMEIFVTTGTLVTITFITVRLGHTMSGYLLMTIVSAGVFAFLFAKAVISKFSVGFKNATLLRSFKGLEILLGMPPGVRRAYLRDVRRLPVIKIPIGLGGTVFMIINKDMNAKLSGLFIDLCMETLVLF